MSKKILCAAVAFAGSLFCAAGVARAEGTRSTAHEGIALSNFYSQNTWTQEMLRMWRLTAKHAKADGIVGRTKVVNSGNSLVQQENQLSDLVIGGWNAIVVDAKSPTALNGVIERACKAGIVVVTYNALATAPCAYKVPFNFVGLGKTEAAFVAKALHKKGHVLEIRGVAGVSVDQDIHRGIVQEFKKFPGIQIVGSVHGDWTESIARKAVEGILPSLPSVQAVVTQGGDGYGAYQAFKASGRKTPLIIFGNRDDELRLWKKLRSRPGGYHTLSLSPAPGAASVAFWVAQRVLAGAKVPKVVRMPLLVIKSAELKRWLDAMPHGSVATPIYTQKWTEKLIRANLNHSKLPTSPPPPKHLP